ncbi:MAG: DUF4381 family protein [Desulfobacteraceae bacterium]|nr:DUF4381 family protein [Desulfobacteraceae bacterium]
MTDIHDIKPALVMGLDWSWWPWAAAALAVIAAVLLAWWLWRRRKKSTEPLLTPVLSPEAEAYALLDALAADNLNDGKLYYFRLSAILRGYVERRFEFPAAEMTLEELLPRLAQVSLPKELDQPFIDFCRRAEPIKFAGLAADAGRRGLDLMFARDFVQRTTPSAMEPTVPTEDTSSQRWADRIPLAQKAVSQSSQRLIAAESKTVKED